MTKKLNEFHEFDNIPFHKIIIVYHTDIFCLVPDEFYNPDNHKDYLKLSYSLSEKEYIYSSDLEEIKAKVLFSLPHELNSLINLKFPDAILLHSACPSLNFGIRKSEKVCIVYNYGTSISIAVFDREQLKLFNVYVVHNENDLIYYILNTLKSCNQKVAETVFYFSGVREENSDDSMLQSKYISKSVYFNPELKEVNTLVFPVNLLFNHLEGLSCVL